MFDKTEYWKNRKAAKRGQGEVPRNRFTPTPGKHLVQVGAKLQLVNRAAARKMGDTAAARRKADK